MYRDPKQWAYIRRLIIEEGHSRKGVSRMTGLNRTTIRRMLKSSQPPQPRVPDSADQKLLKAAQILSRPPANGRWTGLFAWDESYGGQACRENRRSRLMLRNRPSCAPCRSRSSAAK